MLYFPVSLLLSFSCAGQDTNQGRSSSFWPLCSILSQLAHTQTFPYRWKNKISCPHIQYVQYSLCCVISTTVSLWNDECASFLTWRDWTKESLLNFRRAMRRTVEKLQCGRKRIGSRFRGFFHLQLLQPGPHCQTLSTLSLKLAPRTIFLVWAKFAFQKLETRVASYCFICSWFSCQKLIFYWKKFLSIINSYLENLSLMDPIGPTFQKCFWRLPEICIKSLQNPNVSTPEKPRNLLQ